LEVSAPAGWWQLLPLSKAGHYWVLHAAAPSSSLLPPQASAPTTQGLYLDFHSAFLPAQVLALAKQGGVSSFPYDRSIGINKIEKSNYLTAVAGNQLF